MKKIIFTGILLLTLGAAWMLYLEPEKKRFVESLPKQPTVDVENRGEHGHLHDENGEFESEEPSEAITLEQHSNEPGLDETAGTDVPVSQPFVHVHGEHCRTPGNPQVFTGRLSDEVLEKLEQSLIARFGDIPAVQIYMNHHRESADRGWTSDEMMAYHLARLELFPHLRPEIEEAIQRTEAYRTNPPTGPPVSVD